VHIVEAGGVKPRQGVLGAIAISALVVGSACGGQPQPGGAAGPPTAPPAVTAAPASPPPAPAQPATASVGKWNFDADTLGSLPPGAQSFSGQWAVRADPDSPSPPNALCQTGQADYPAIGLDGKPFTDLTLLTHFKPISGKSDQAGGLIFRVQNKDNYYIFRANALENNGIFFTYVNAGRSQLKAGDAKVSSGTWHELRVEVRGNVFRGFVDGKQVVDATDERFKSGGIGLWTKADSVTCFDDVEVTSS
jgi:hypothetical protein